MRKFLTEKSEISNIVCLYINISLNNQLPLFTTEGCTMLHINSKPRSVFSKYAACPIDRSPSTGSSIDVCQ